MTKQIASLTLQLNVKKMDVQVALNEGDTLRSELQVVDYIAQARESEWTIEKTKLLGQLLNVCQQLAAATNQARPPSQSDIHNEVTNLKGELDKIIREQDEAMTVATTQARNKARLADYEAMQCEVITAKALLDAFKKKTLHWTPPTSRHSSPNWRYTFRRHLRLTNVMKQLIADNCNKSTRHTLILFIGMIWRIVETKTPLFLNMVIGRPN